MSSDFTGLTGTSFTVLRLYEITKANHIRDAFLLASMAFLEVAGIVLGFIYFVMLFRTAAATMTAKMIYKNAYADTHIHSYTHVNTYTCKHILIITQIYTY